MRSLNRRQLRRLEPSDQDAVRDACLAARVGMSDMVDLLLIHNERPVRGLQPRSVLNRLVVLLAVAPWERLVSDLDAIQRHDFTGPGLQDSLRMAGYLAAPGGCAAPVLDAATGGLLPDAWTVAVPELRVPARTPGTTPAASPETSPAVGPRRISPPPAATLALSDLGTPDA